MDIYHYDSDTKEYKGIEQADESPLEPGVFLVPAFATSIKPPEFGVNEIPVFNELNQAWEVKADYRKVDLFSKESGEKLNNINIGDTPGTLNATLIKPPSTLHKFSNGNWFIDNEKYATALNEAKSVALKRIEATVDNYQRTFLGANSPERMARFSHNLAAAERFIKDDYGLSDAGLALKQADTLAMTIQAEAQNAKPETVVKISALDFAKWVVDWLPQSTAVAAHIENILVIGRTELNKLTEIEQIEPLLTQLAEQAEVKFKQLVC